MGFNSVIFICNDAFRAIDEDPAGWWEKTKAKLASSDCMGGATAEYGFGNHANGFRAVSNQHADYGVLIAAGGNRAEVLARGYAKWRLGREDIKDLFRQWDSKNKATEVQQKWWHYVLECGDGSLYSGITLNLERRLAQHEGKKPGGAKYTKSRGPLKVVYRRLYDTRTLAARAEYRFKQLSREQKLKEIANGNKVD